MSLHKSIYVPLLLQKQGGQNENLNEFHSRDQQAISIYVPSNPKWLILIEQFESNILKFYN